MSDSIDEVVELDLEELIDVKDAEYQKPAQEGRPTDHMAKDAYGYVIVIKDMIISEEPINNSGVKTAQPKPYVKDLPYGRR